MIEIIFLISSLCIGFYFIVGPIKIFLFEQIQKKFSKFSFKIFHA